MHPLLFIDFDNTLFDTAQWLDASLSRSLEPFGVSAGEFMAAYRKMANESREIIGWSPETQIDWIGRVHALHHDSAVRAIDETVDRCASYLFSDARDALKRLHEHFRIVLLSRGNSDFQLHKIRVTGVDRLVDEVIVTPDHKSGAIRFILKPNDDSVYFIDDDIASSLELKDLLPMLNVVLKRRRDVLPERYRLLPIPSYATLTEVAEHVLSAL